MDFGSFGLDTSKEQTGLPTYSHEIDTNELDASDFFAFIDLPEFKSDQQVKNQKQETSNLGSTTNEKYNTQSTVTKNNNNIDVMNMNKQYQTPLQQPMTPITADFLPEDEVFFTPLMSPAIPPNYYSNLRTDAHFSPLTSPALGPQQSSYQINNYLTSATTSDPGIGLQDGQSPEELRERLAMIERQQQQLRSHMKQPSSSSSSSSSSTSSSSSSAPTSPAFISISPLSPVHRSIAPSSINASSSIAKPKQTLRHKIALSSPQFNPTTHLRSPGIQPNYTKQSSNNRHNIIAPATPSLLMKLGTGRPHTSSTYSNEDSNSSPAALSPMTPSHDSIIDNMMSLPDAMLPPSNITTSIKPTNKTPDNIDSNTPSTKRQRISYPRAAFTPPALLPSSQFYQQQQQYHHSGNGMAVFDQGIAALISPAALRPHIPPSPSTNSNGITSSPRALKPLISPSLQPNGKRLSSIDEHHAASILASKSNYQTLREGQAKSLGIDFNTNIQSGMENRRSAHKAAEQRRRDTLKQNFDALRTELLEAMVAEDALQRLEDDDQGDSGMARLEREKKVKQMSKVVLLQHSYEYILRLKSENKVKDTKMDLMADEIRQLRTRLGLPEITDEERLAEAEEKQLEKERRLARLKRLEDVMDS